MAMHEIMENATGFDELLAGPEVHVLTKNIKLKAGTAYKRGMLISYVAAVTAEAGAGEGASSGDGASLEGGASAAGTAATAPAKTGKQTAAGETAEFVLMRDVDAAEADAVGTVYVSGRFHREKIVLAAGDTVEAHEDELRLRNIYFTTLKS